MIAIEAADLSAGVPVDQYFVKPVATSEDAYNLTMFIRLTLSSHC